MYKNPKTSELELKPDGTFFIKNVAAIWEPFPKADGFESARGKWLLTSHQDWWAVQLDVTSVKEDGRLNQQGFGTQAMLIGQDVPYTLHFSIGDPDSGDALQYELQ